jgi:hypothetical protein
LGIAACGGGANSNQVAPINLTGNWLGTTQDNLAGTGQLSFFLTQQGQSITGNWSVTYTNSPSFNDSGNVSGSVSGLTVQMTLAPASPNPCTTTATGTTNAMGSHANGSYDNGSCPNHDTGTFTVDKQP